MYWSRTGSIFDLLAWGLLFSLFWAGGCLLCAYVFRLRSREIPLTGMGVGFLLFILLSNLLAYGLPLPLANWVAAVLLFLCGVLAGWRSRFHLRMKPGHLMKYWKQAAAFTFLMVLFSLILRGLTIFDEYSNLPLVGTLASGTFPPRFYLDSEIPLFYHHGLHMFAASLVQIGGLLVWSAFDLSRTFTIVLTILFAWLWVRRYSHNRYFMAFTLSLVLFASGARWLLLLLPQNALEHVSASLTLQGSALETDPTFKAALLKPWNIESGSSLPFPFAFANGIIPPLSLALGGSGAAPQMALILFLLLSRRRWQASTGLLFGCLLASLGLLGEYLLVMALAGTFIALVIAFIKKSSTKDLWGWGWLFIPSAVLIPIMGGVLTGITRSIAARLIGTSFSNLTFTGISLRWPPGFTSSHLGNLSFLNLDQLVVSAAEIGPILFLAPLTLWIIHKSLGSRKLILAGLGIGAWIGVIVPLFLRLSFSDRDVSRIIGFGLFTWLIISLPWWWIYLRKNHNRWIVGLSFWGLTILSGLALFPAQWIAIQQTRYSYFLDEPDALMSRMHWDELDRNAKMLDLSNPSRPGTLFGLSNGHAYQDINTPFPEFAALQNNPDPGLAAEAGYSYIYLDRDAWQNLSGTQKNAFERNCVHRIAEYRSVTNDFRRLYDIRQCTK